MTLSRESSREELLRENGRLQAQLDQALAMAANAMEYIVLLPDQGGVEVLVKRQILGRSPGWAACLRLRGGGHAWTREGWQETVSALSVDRLFCWPDPETALKEIRDALATKRVDQERG